MSELDKHGASIPPMGDEDGMRRWRPVSTGAPGCFELMFELEGEVYRLAIWPAPSSSSPTMMGSLEREAVGDTIWLEALETTDHELAKRECLQRARAVLMDVVRALGELERELGR